MLKKFIIASVLFSFAVSLGVFAQAETTTAPATTTAPVQKATTKTIDFVCMQTATDKRDTAIIAAWDKLSLAVKTALDTRKTALKSAWGNSDKKARREAIKKTWNDYSQAVKNSRKILNSARKAAWKQFNTERKNCGGLPDDATTESVDNQL